MCFGVQINQIQFMPYMQLFWEVNTISCGLSISGFDMAILVSHFKLLYKKTGILFSQYF